MVKGGVQLPVLISDLAIMLLTAGVVTLIFKKIKQPLVLGYIVAGFLIGQYTPWFFTVEDAVSIQTWSEIGIIILMFGLGLEFNIHKLVRVGGTALITALTEVCGMLVFGFAVGQLMGWGVMDSVFLGGMLSMSSTTIIIKAFDELGVRQESFAQLVFGTLVVEDIAGIFMMIILSTVSVSQSISGAALALKLGLLVLYLAVWLLLGIYLLPTFLGKASPLMNDETLLIVSLGLCFGMVLLAEELGFSSALGAFLAGSLLAGTVHAERVEHLCAGVKDLFGSVFFLSVGMMLDPSMIVKYIVPILIITAVTVVGKLLFSSLGVLLSGQSLKNAVHCGCSLAQIGEFAFIIASLGLSLGVIAEYVYPIIVSVSIITTLTTPFFIKGADGIYRRIAALLPEKLKTKLERYTDADRGDKEQDGDWTVFLRRYGKRTALYGVILFGIYLLAQHVLLPALLRLPIEPTISRAVTLAAALVSMALFIRPMMDLRSPEYTALWLKGRSFRLPLMALNALRLLIIVMLLFLPVQNIAQVGGLWLVPVTGLAVWLLSRTGWLSTAYFSVEARFLANFNERQLRSAENDGEVTEWLDERLHVLELCCDNGSDMAGKTLRSLGWGKKFGVNVIQLLRGKRRISMPSGECTLHGGDRLFVIGEEGALRNLCLRLAVPVPELPTLRGFAQTGSELYSCALAVEKGSPLSGKTIRSSGIREKTGCMVLGLQRERLPILQPDVDMSLQSGDIVWVLGTRSMAAKLMAELPPSEGTA